MDKQSKENIQTATASSIESSGLLCDGNCIEYHGSHKGEVSRVLVTDGEWDFEFNYCEQAIKDDKSEGFNIHFIT